MACPPVLGRILTAATVLDQSILGGPTMIAHEARWDLLGSGALPAKPPACLTLADEVDVADLESEAAHGYELGLTWDTDNQVVLQGWEKPIADGGRLHRTKDRFRVRLPKGAPAELVMRVSAETPLDLVVSAGGREVGSVAVEAEGGWMEGKVSLPAEATGPEFHYWVYGS
jgi:hypothetical protein